MTIRLNPIAAAKYAAVVAALAAVGVKESEFVVLSTAHDIVLAGTDPEQFTEGVTVGEVVDTLCQDGEELWRSMHEDAATLVEE